MSQTLCWVSFSPSPKYTQNGCFPCLPAYRKLCFISSHAFSCCSSFCSVLHENVVLFRTPKATLPCLFAMCGGVKGGQRAEGRFQCAPVSLICTNGDDRAIQLINHDTHGTANKFDKILITPYSVVWATNHENDNPLGCRHSRTIPLGRQV